MKLTIPRLLLIGGATYLALVLFTWRVEDAGVRLTSNNLDEKKSEV